MVKVRRLLLAAIICSSRYTLVDSGRRSYSVYVALCCSSANRVCCVSITNWIFRLCSVLHRMNRFNLVRVAFVVAGLQFIERQGPFIVARFYSRSLGNRRILGPSRLRCWTLWPLPRPTSRIGKSWINSRQAAQHSVIVFLCI